MNIKLTPLRLHGLGMAVAGLLLCGLAHAAVPGQPGQIVQFSWQVTAGTCSISGDVDGVKTNSYTIPATRIAYPALTGTGDGYGIWASWITGSRPKYTITLSGCDGLAGTNRPVVTVHGNTSEWTGAGAPTDLFSEPSASSTKGLGFYLRKVTDVGGSNKSNTAINDEQLYIVKSGTGASTTYYGPGETPKANSTIPLEIGISCGGTLDLCKSTNLRSGNLQATFTFTFAYK